MKIDSFLLILSRVFQIGVSLLIVRIITSLYNPEEIGNYYILLSYSSLIILLCHSSVSSYISREFFSFCERNQLISVLKSYVIYAIIVQLIFFPILTVLYNFLDYKEKYSLPVFILVVSFSVVSTSIYNRLSSALNMLGELKAFSYVMMLSATLTLVMSYVLSHYFTSPIVWILGSIFSFLTFSIVCLILVRLKEDTSYSVSFDYKKIFFFAYPMAISSFLMWGQNLGYRVIIDYKFSPEFLGYLAVGFGIPIAIFSAVNTLIAQYFYPHFYKKTNNGNGAEAWNSMAKIVFPIYLVTLVYIISLSKYLLVLLVGDKYLGIQELVAWGAVIESLKYVALTYSLLSQVKYETSKIVAPYFYGSITLCFALLIIDSDSKDIIPIVLLFSSLIIALVIRFRMRHLISSFSITVNSVICYLIIFGTLSIPYWIDKPVDSILYSFIYVLIFGLIYVCSVYFIIFRINNYKASYD